MSDETEKLKESAEESKKKLGSPIVVDQKTSSSLWFDQRELDVRYLISVERIKKFYEGISEGKVMATKCSKCGEIYFPPQSYCNKCGSDSIEWIELSGSGELLTYTVINVKPQSFSHYPDYAVGIARMPQGVNVLAWIDGDIKGIKVGMKVKLEVKKREPEGYLTYWIKPE